MRSSPRHRVSETFCVNVATCRTSGKLQHTAQEEKHQVQLQQDFYSKKKKTKAYIQELKMHILTCVNYMCKYTKWENNVLQ